MVIVGWIGLGVVVLAIAIIVGIRFYLNRNSKPTYITKHGCKVWCQGAKHMKSKRADVERECDKFLEAASLKFKRQDILDALKELTITFKDKPFPPEGPVATDAELLSGVFIHREKRVVVYTSKDNSLEKSALAHEMIHFMMYQVDGIIDYNNSMKEYWGLIGE